MIDAEMISKISREDLNVLSDIYSLSQEATEVEMLIHSVWTFKIGEKIINVLDSQECSMFLSQETGELKVKNENEEIYTIACNEDEIFDYFRAEFLVQKGYKVNDNIKDKANSCIYLRKFIDKTMEVLNRRSGRNDRQI